MEVKISKADVVWSYIAQFFNLATGLITLPLILKLLTSEEVGFNYILISINSIVNLFDMGFSGQFSRYLTYIFCGAQTIQKDGIPSEYTEHINGHLLASVIVTAKRIYLYMSFIVLVLLFTFGSFYVYSITNGFLIIDNSLIIWLVFCFSSFFNIYFLYFNAFLQGRGLVKETKQAQVMARVLQITMTFVMLYMGCGLLSVVIPNLISPFIFRILAYRKFYTKDVLLILKNNIIEKTEVQEIFSILLYNAKKMGFIGILSSAIGYASTLIIGNYMSLADVGSYGIMVQLVGVIMGLSTIHFTSSIPELAGLMLKNDQSAIRQSFGMSMFFFIVICFGGFIGLTIAPLLFEAFNFNTQLPSFYVILLYYFYKFNEQHQSLYSQLFLIKNDLRFFNSAVITGTISFLFLWFSLRVNLGLLGVVISQAIPLFCYSAWKWPYEAVHHFNIKPINDIFITPVKILFYRVYV